MVDILFCFNFYCQSINILTGCFFYTLVFFFDYPFFLSGQLSIWGSKNPTDVGKLPVLLKWDQNIKDWRNTMKATTVPAVHACLHTCTRSWSIQEQPAAGVIFEAVAVRRGQLSLLGHMPSVSLGQNVGIFFIHCHSGAWGSGSLKTMPLPHSWPPGSKRGKRWEQALAEQGLSISADAVEPSQLTYPSPLLLPCKLAKVSDTHQLGKGFVT